MIKIGDLIKVEWLDACQREYQNYIIYDLKDFKVEDILIKQTTYGKFIAMNDDVVLIQHEEDNYSPDEKECTAIPRSWIVKPKKLRDKRMMN